MPSDYLKYRGKCYEMSKEMADNSNGELTQVRGFYYEPVWSKDEQHWWCVDKDGVIHDPTAKQFPTGGCKEFYTEFTGVYECEQCGCEVKEESAISLSNYIVCSNQCARSLVGV